MASPDETRFCRSKDRSSVALCLLLTALVCHDAVGGEHFTSGQEALPSLEAGKTIERQLSGGETHAYQVNLALGQCLRVIADQHGIDVAIKISRSNGQQLIEMDSLNGTQGLEIASIISEQAEVYRVEIRSSSKSVPRGRYEARIEISEAVTEKDRQWIGAQQAYTEGRRFRAQGTAEANSQAIRQFEKASSDWQTLNDKLMTAHALYYLANIHQRVGQMRQSLSYYDQARQLMTEIGEPREVAIAEFFIAGLYSRLGEPRKSLEYYDRALTQWRALKDSYIETRTLLNLGEAYAKLGDARRALQYYNQALELWQKLDNRQQMADTLINIGGYYELLGEWQKALEHYERSLTLYRALGNKQEEAGSLNNLGFIYEQLNEPRKALEYYEQALSQRQALGDRTEEARVLMNLGSAYSRMKIQPKALECFDQALQLWRQGRDRRGEGYALLLIGELNATSDPRKAQEYYDQALPLLRATEDRWREAVALRGLGMIHTSLGDLRVAQENLNLALDLFRQVGNQSGEAQTLYGLARLERERGDFAATLRWIESAITLAERSRAEVRSQQLRASYLTSAQKFYELEIDTLMRMHQARPMGGFDAMAAQVSERARARSLLELLVESRVDIREGVDAALLERERDLTQQLNSKAARQLQLSANSPQLAELKLEISQLENEFEQVRSTIRKVSPHYDALVQPQPLTLAEIQQQLDDDTLLLEYKLGEERSWLWAISNRTLKSYELPKREQIESVADQFRKQLTARSRVAKGETPLRRSRRIAEADAQLPKIAKRLSAMILDPAAAQFTNKRLVIVPDGALHYISFAPLPARETARRAVRATGRLADKGGRIFHSPLPVPLVVNHEIVILPSASVIATQRRELLGRPIAPKLLAALADPVFQIEDERIGRMERRAAVERQDSRSKAASVTRSIEHPTEESLSDLGRKLPRLPFSRREVDRILALAPAKATFKAIGFDASRATALNPELGRYRYLHFATHGLLDSERPGLSALALSLVGEDGQPQDGFLRVNDIYNLKLPAELVVLSACQTGLGKAVNGEGLVGLTRGFMYSGAARVVVSLWNVNDQATSELMTRFYRKILIENQRPASALRMAQVEMFRQKQWQSPYYWATFIIQGEWK